MSLKSQIQIVTIVFLAFQFSLLSSADFVPCRSITLRGVVTLNQLSNVRNCTLILGHFRILNAKFIDFTNSSTSAPLFPNLTEITDYLLIFQAQYISDLSQLLPRLSIIRGNRLFRSSFSLIVFLVQSLTHLNLNRLVQIQKGFVLLSRLYHTCYVTTVDWSQIVGRQQENNETIIMNLINTNCFGQVCLRGATHCWNEKTPQIECNRECSNGCNLDAPNQCCNDPMCLYCFNSTSSKNSTECASCSGMRDITTGKCVNQCPTGLLSFDSHSCIGVDECRSRNYFIIQESQSCAQKCPNGYRQSSSNSSSSSCIPCPDGVCKRDCRHLTFHLKSVSDLASIRNCIRVKRLTIEIQTTAITDLESSLHYLEEIDDYLLITRNRYLVNLGFLSRLKVIYGNELFEQKYSLFVHTNPKLRILWTGNFRLFKGGIKFFENPLLCYQHAEKFVMEILKSSNELDLVELSYNYNGYKRLTCSNRTLALDIEVKKGHFDIEWDVDISDLRRLKGFLIGYMEVSNEKQKKLLEDEEYDSEEKWAYLYVSYSQRSSNMKLPLKQKMRGQIEVRPFRKYAVYVKADLMIDTNWANRTASFEYDRVISKISYVISLPAQPSRVESIEYELISYDIANLKWKPPKYPNGIIEFYFISYTILKDMEKLEIVDGDNCQYDRYLIENQDINSYENKLKTTTTITTVSSTAKVQVKQAEKDILKIRKEMCENSNVLSDLNQMRSDDDTKNDIISVEDEIYNLAFRPAKPSRTSAFLDNVTTTKSIFFNSTSPTKFDIKHLENTSLPKSNDLAAPIKEIAHLNKSDILNLFDTNESLLRLVRKDLFIQEDGKINFIKTSNNTFNVTIGNLTSFGRYIVSIFACQNFTHDLLKYSKTYNYTGYKPERFSNYLKYFQLDQYCSKSNLITLRSLPDERLDQIENVQLVTENNIQYFKWSKPTKPNGFIYKYNLKFIDINLNKTQGPLCHPSLDSLKVALNQFLLTEGHAYLIQIQAVSTAGAGPWSLPNIKYHVPSISQYYFILAAEVLGALVIVIVILIILFFSLRIYYRSKERGYFSIKSHYYYFRPDEWEIKRENLIIGERIGSGCFAEVHQGKLKLEKSSSNDSVSLVDCAIKFCGSDHQSRQRLLKEANMMKSINTTHIVKMLGVISRENPAYLILEFMEKGDLKEYLRNLKSECREPFSIERFYRMAAEIADGMLWLSEHKYIHRDLAARNCLISNNDVIKIADLGLSKDIYQNPVYREKCKALLPIRWMAPESLLNGSSTTKSDVWSYGVVIWEIVTYGENPYNGQENEEVVQFVKTGGRLQLPSNAPNKFCAIFNKCMITNDSERASFKDILDTLDPDLSVDFKQTSFYHNDYRKRLFNKMNAKAIDNNNFDNILDAIKIVEPFIGDSDNYM